MEGITDLRLGDGVVHGVISSSDASHAVHLVEPSLERAKVRHVVRRGITGKPRPRTRTQPPQALFLRQRIDTAYCVLSQPSIWARSRRGGPRAAPRVRSYKYRREQAARGSRGAQRTVVPPRLSMRGCRRLAPLLTCSGPRRPGVLVCKHAVVDLRVRQARPSGRCTT